MEYVKGTPYFCKTAQEIKQYPYLSDNCSCDILIIGGGIDGAIANYYLSQKYKVVLVDKSRFGMGCTSCATALLEYQLDEFAEDLSKYLSDEEIVSVYKMGIKSIDKIENFIKKYGNECDFSRRPTFLYTAKAGNKNKIEKEYVFRRDNGFDCELITKYNNPFSFCVECGIYSNKGGCEFNPYLFTKQMIENSVNQSTLYENTNISNLIKTEGGYIAITNYSKEIFCKKVLIATGFNWEILNKDDLCERFITYTIVTKPIKNFVLYNNSLIHDASDPYHYFRLLPDNRIIFGGEDISFKMKPINQKKSNKIYDALEISLKELFPELNSQIKVDSRFCGAFGTTANNLGLIGESRIDKDILLFISCGANGIINAFEGVKIIEDIIEGRDNSFIKLFSPLRDI